MTQYLFIIGATGKVGSTLVRQIYQNKDDDYLIHKNPTRIVGLASSSSYLFFRDCLDRKSCEAFSRKEIFGKAYKGPFDFFVAAKEAGFGYEKKLIFVDVTASREMTSFHLRVAEEPQMGMVTANKNPITLSGYDIFRKLTSDVSSYGYRCSVMAGAEAVSLLQDLRDVNDAPSEISGCFSGTLGYICSEMEKGSALSAIIGDARDKGYTEPHPRDDLNGLDVARKLLTLARTAGYPANLTDVKVEPFIPEGYLAEDDVDKFIRKTSELNDHFRGKVQAAAQKGNVLRYVARLARGSKLSLSVRLEEVPRESPLGLLKGTANKITVVSKIYPKGLPYLSQTPR